MAGMNSRACVRFIACLVVCTIAACAQSRTALTKRFSGNSVKYWDAVVGWDWAFYSDGRFVEYLTDSTGRQFADYGDFRIRGMTFASKGDSIIVLAGVKRLREYKVENVTEEELVVTSRKTGWGTDTLRFTASQDQHTTPRALPE